MNLFTAQRTIQGHEHEVSGIAFIPTHPDFLISCSRDQSIRVWDTLSGVCLQTITQGHTDWIKRISVSPNGVYFASASNDETIIIWNTQ